MRSQLYCSFCGHNQYEVAQLIAGPTVFICDECVEVCAWIVAEKTTPLSRAWRKTWQIAPPTPLPTQSNDTRGRDEGP